MYLKWLNWLPELSIVSDRFENGFLVHLDTLISLFLWYLPNSKVNFLFFWSFRNFCHTESWSIKKSLNTHTLYTCFLSGEGIHSHFLFQTNDFFIIISHCFYLITNLFHLLSKLIIRWNLTGSGRLSFGELNILIASHLYQLVIQIIRRHIIIRVVQG